MAKKKLTIEEKLQAALVPAEEQPYKVPENWCWVKLGAVITASKEKQDVFDSETKYVGLEHIEKDTGNISFAVADGVKSTKSVFKCGDILYGKLRPYLNKHGIVDFDGVCSTDILVFNAIEGDNRLYDFYFSLPHFIEYAVSNSKGINLPRVSEKVILEIPFPMSPQDEQSRIVARIESLFAKLDEAKEKIQEVLDGADLRRAAILHQAFTGNLTEKWRKSHTVTCAKDLQTKALVAREGQPESWIRCKIGDYLELKAGKFISAAEINAEISDVTPYECFGGNGIRGYVKNYNTEGTHPLIGRQGALCGNVQVGEGKFYATEHAVVVTYKYDTDTMWIVELLRHMNLNQYSRSVAQPGLAVKNIVELPIVIAPYEEQVEIGRILDNLLSREQSTVTACEEALTTIDTLQKSILARAFRGELGTNDPADPSAKELLREILSA